MSEKYELYFEIKGLPPTHNDQLRYKSWRTRQGNTKKWKKLVSEAIIEKRKPTQPLTKAKLVLTRHSTTRGDYDGRVSSFKSTIDGLVEAKILAGDTEDFIGIPEYLWEKAKRGEGKISVKVIEL